VGSNSAGHASNSMYAKSFKWLLAILAGLAQAQAASTDDDCKGTSSECVAVGKWNFSVALGAGLRSNPLVTGKNIPLVVIPQFSYYGNRFFINDLDLGFTLVENTTNTFSLVGSPGYDRVFFYRSDLQNIFIGLPGLGTNVAQRVPASTPNAVQFPAPARPVTSAHTSAPARRTARVPRGARTEPPGPGARPPSGGVTRLAQIACIWSVAVDEKQKQKGVHAGGHSPQEGPTGRPNIQPPSPF